MAPVTIRKKEACAFESCARRLTFLEKTTCVCNKCKQFYCTLHRLAEAHSCKHDFKSDVDKEKFIKDNKCVGEKITTF